RTFFNTSYLHKSRPDLHIPDLHCNSRGCNFSFPLFSISSYSPSDRRRSLAPRSGTLKHPTKARSAATADAAQSVMDKEVNTAWDQIRPGLSCNLNPGGVTFEIEKSIPEKRILQYNVIIDLAAHGGHASMPRPLRVSESDPQATQLPQTSVPGGPGNQGRVHTLLGPPLHVTDLERPADPGRGMPGRPGIPTKSVG
ncbi:hypothetical protein PoB_004037300, partial [Plakobranchus ocellatus]